MFWVKVTQEVIFILFLELPKPLDFFEHTHIMIAV